MVKALNNSRPSRPPGRPPGLRLRGKPVDRLLTGIAVLDAAGRIRGANRAFINTFGYKPSVANNHEFLKMLDVNSEGLRKLLSSRPLVQNFADIPLADKDGKTLYVSGRLVKIRKNYILCEVRKVGEKEGPHSLTNEQRRLIETGKTTHHIMHALKGGIITLRNIYDLLGSQPTLGEISHYLPVINRLVERLFTIMDETLEISSKRESEFSAVNLPELLNQVTELPEISERLKNIKLDVSGTCSPIEGAAKELREAFACFIGNSIEAIAETGREDGEIAIEFKEDEAEPNEVHIVIRDNGCGIPTDKISSIFKFFYTTKRGGSGIGLSVCRKFIKEIHGGRITVTSQAGEGATFEVFLPLKPPKDAFLNQPSGISEKLAEVRKKIDKLREQDPNLEQALVEDCIASMTMENVRKDTVDQICEQILWQIRRLEEFLDTGVPHLSVNNFSGRTEIVLAADKDSTPRNEWLDLIRYEMQKIVAHELDVNVVATRITEKQKGDLRGVCRIFVVRKFKGQNLTEDERIKLERALAQKLTPLPSLKELELQKQFLDAAYIVLQELSGPAELTGSEGGHAGSIHSLIFKSSARNGRTRRLVGYKIRFLPSLPIFEEPIARRYLLGRPKPAGILAYLIGQLGRSQESTLSKKVDDKFLAAYPIDTFTKRIISAFNINSVSSSVFRTPEGGIVVNIFCSTYDKKLPEETAAELVALNQAWKDAYPS